MGVGCCAGCAEGAAVPGGCSVGVGGRRAGYGAYGEGVRAGVIFEWSRGIQVVGYRPGRSSVSAPSMLCCLLNVIGGAGGKGSQVLQILVRDCHPGFIVDVECHDHVGQVA